MQASQDRRWCIRIGQRVEFRADCPTGFMCRHECTSKRKDVAAHLGGVMQATPGDDCMDCPGREFAPSDIE